MKTLDTRPFVRPLALAGAFAALPAAAQNVPADAWEFEITPYFWATAVRADVDTRLFGTHRLYVPFSDLASALDFGAMGTLEARKGRWGGLMDVQYVKLGTSTTSLLAPLATIDTDYEQQIWTLAAFYRVAEGPVTVDVLGGARYLQAKTDIGV